MQDSFDDEEPTQPRPARRDERHGARTLIIADDNEHMRWVVGATLRDQFDDVIEVADGRALFRQLVHCSMTRAARDVVVVTDIRMPGYSGLDVVATYDELSYHPTTIVMTAFPDPSAYASTARAGGLLIPKPFATSELRAIVERACAR